MNDLIKIHPKFKLNGVFYSNDELKELAYDLIKEGQPFEQEIGDFLSNWLDENQVVKVQTSGSTGTPKTIELQKLHMVNSALATRDFFKLEEGDMALLCLPVTYIAGKMMLVRALVIGLELNYVEPSSNPLSGNFSSYDFCAMVPLQLANSLDGLRRIKTLIVGGATVSAELIEKAQATSTAIYETYGMTETITHVAARKCKTKLPVSLSGVENAFKALPNIFFKKDDRDCLVINALEVSNEQVITNDVVELISETEFKWLGRYDNIINSGGVKLIPEEIESKLSHFIENRFFVAGVPDEKLGQRLVMVVEGEVNTQNLHQQLKAANILKRFEIPKSIYMLPKFIETETGKIRRKENLLEIKA